MSTFSVKDIIDLDLILFFYEIPPNQIKGNNSELEAASCGFTLAVILVRRTPSLEGMSKNET